MPGGETSSGKKVPRKIVEKKRRTLMKLICFKLVSLIPNHLFSQPKISKISKRYIIKKIFDVVGQELLSQQDQVHHSVAYIEFLRERVEELRRRKAQLMNTNNNMIEQPILTVKELGCGVEVVLITGLSKNFKMHDVITIIEQHAAEVLTVNISTVDAKTIHTIHAQVKVSRVGVDIATISERIHELISSSL